MEGLALAAIGVGWLLMRTGLNPREIGDWSPLGALLFFGGLYVAAPMLLLLAATVIYGPFILLFQWLGFGTILLIVLIIVAAWFVWFLYDEYIKKSDFIQKAKKLWTNIID